MPFEMSEGIQSVAVQGKVYIGGGSTNKDDGYDSTVMEFDTITQEWNTLLPYIAIWFSMVAINNQLVLVGGYEEGKTSKKLGVWNKSNWIYPYPLMPTARCGCSAVVNNNWLAVVGGIKSDLESFVEVLNTNTGQWHATLSTPISWTAMKTAIIDDTCYFIGGYSLETESAVIKNYSIPMQALFHASSNQIDMWKEIPVVKDHSSPLAIDGYLLTFGGLDSETNCAVSSIYLYQPDLYSPKWVKLGDLLSPRYHCTCTMITSRVLFLAGGSHFNDIEQDDCYIAHIC